MQEGTLTSLTPILPKSLLYESRRLRHKWGHA